MKSNCVKRVIGEQQHTTKGNKKRERDVRKRNRFNKKPSDREGEKKNPGKKEKKSVKQLREKCVKASNNNNKIKKNKE